MIKIISKNEYETLNHTIEVLETKRRELVKNNYELQKELKQEKINNKTLKSKITRLQNQIKKMQEEEQKDKKLVKETLKEVHEVHKKKAIAKKTKKGDEK